jgi:ubiquinone/menaquinone biosynthesis C-methylase UbiE
MPSQDITHFTTVDRTADPGFFLHFLDEANKIPGVIAWKRQILDRLNLRPGMKALEIGCGAGDDAFDMAQRISPGGSVVGVDFSESLIAEATRRAVKQTLPVAFQIGDAQALRFPDATFDAVRTERMLMHVPDPEKAIHEMSRVLKPAGRMAVFDFDWESQFCDSPYRDVTRKIALSFCDSMKNGWIGRRLPRFFRDAGMTDVYVFYITLTVSYDFLQLLVGGHVAKIVANGIISGEEADAWWTHLAQADAEGNFLYGFTGSIVSGTR